MKVRSYIALLTLGSVGGALLLAIFGRSIFASLQEGTRQLEEEAKKTGKSSEEYADVHAFLSTSRSIFVSLDIYPRDYPGIFYVTSDALVLAKEGLNVIAENYLINYPESILAPIQKDLSEIEVEIEKMAKTSPWSGDKGWENRNRIARKNYEIVRDNLKRSLDVLELMAEKVRRKSELALAKKWEDLQQREESGNVLLILASLAYFSLVCFLAFATYKSFARPIRNLEQAANNSIERQLPFLMNEEGPYEIRSLTRRLKGLILGLEDTVKERTAALQSKTNLLQAEIIQRQELETQLVHAQKMEAVGQLASGIAHEINSPSQFANDNILFLKDAVRGFISKIESATDAPDHKEIEFLKKNAPEAVEQAKEGISRITTIVKSMKNFAYRDAASQKRPNDLNQAIKSTIVVASNEWKYHAECKVDLDESLPMVSCNIGEINQVVLNLIVNGAHAIRDRFTDGQKGNLLITTKYYSDPKCAVITIKDNGGGIPSKVQSRIFEPFFTTKEVGVGTGQGLAIAHNVIVKSHGGQIWFDTKEGIGTTFFIKLGIENEH